MFAWAKRLFILKGSLCGVIANATTLKKEPYDTKIN